MSIRFQSGMLEIKSQFYVNAINNIHSMHNLLHNKPQTPQFVISQFHGFWDMA